MRRKIIPVLLTAFSLTAPLLAGCSSTSSGEETTELVSEDASSTLTADLETNLYSDWESSSITENTLESGDTYSESAYLSGITASDYVRLPDYSTILLDLEEPEVSDAEVEEEVELMLELYASYEEITDRNTVKNGDIANIDYVGTLDGEEFSGGSYEGYDLEIGSGTFIDGFEEGLIGCEVGETVELELTFPETYTAELAGEDVVFTVTINAIYELVTPDFSDEWVASLGISDVTTTDDYREYVREYLYEEKYEEYVYNLETLAGEYVIDNAEIIQDLPQDFINRYFDQMKSYYTSYAAYFDMEYADFMVYFFNADENDPDALLVEAAEVTAKELIVLQAVADAEGLNLSEEEEEAAIQEYATYYGYESVEQMEEYEDVESVREYLMSQEVYEYLAGNVVTD